MTILRSFEETSVSRLNLGHGGIVLHQLWDKFKVELSGVESMGPMKVNLLSSFGPNSLVEPRPV
jgi:hypothetical protein